MVGKMYTVNAKRNKFKMKWRHHFTTKFGQAIPAMCLEFVPGDSFKINLSQLIRMLPLQTPTMSNIKARIDFFRVDNNTIFDKWTDFIKQNGSEPTPIVAPYKVIPDGGFKEGSLPDYLGVPTKTGKGLKISALPFRAYHMICNKYYINSNLQDEVEISKADGGDSITPFDLRYVNWRRDRFGSAETSRQSGSDIVLPVGQKADVVFDWSSNSSVDQFFRPLLTMKSKGRSDNINSGFQISQTPASKDRAYAIGQDLPNNVYADLSSATGVSLPALSIAKTMQHLREVSLFAGKHYSDWQFANWGVKALDASLQEPRWLGGMKWDFITSEVLQTSESSNSSVQGTMAGHGFTTGGNTLYTSYLDSYGFIMGILTIMPEPEYQQGIDKMFLRTSNFDYALPLLTHMPMQEIKNSEIFLQNEDVVEHGKPVNDGIFGYECIYDDYRHKTNRTSGDFRTTLSHWLLNRIFDSLPKLNADFVSAKKTPMGIFAVDPNVCDPLLCDFAFDITALRKLPKEGIPLF